MKQTPLFCRLVAVTALCYSGFALAHDGTINVTGTINDNTCSVSADSKALTVSMQDVANRQFARAGDGGPWQPFVLHLERCGGAAKQVSVTFAGTADTADPELLATGSGSDAAQGVAIALYDRDKTPIPINSSAEVTTLTPHQAKVDLPFYARYMANGETVRTGRASATATFSLVYD